ncbi:MAG: hypothetical protein Q8J89_05640 [Caulobacter sp.]|nr:hypothetical protein [Caulobacter sp.]
MIWLLAAAVVSLGTQADIDAWLKAKPEITIEQIVGKIGAPSYDLPRRDRRTYFWRSSEQQELRRESGRFPFNNPTSPRIGSTYVPVCSLEVTATPDGTVKEWRWKGRPEDCNALAQELATKRLELTSALLRAEDGLRVQIVGKPMTEVVMLSTVAMTQGDHDRQFRWRWGGRQKCRLTIEADADGLLADLKLEGLSDYCSETVPKAEFKTRP